MIVVDGNKIAQDILIRLKDIISRNNLHPKLHIINVGNNFASNVYIDKKKTAAEYIGAEVVIHNFDNSTEEDLINLIENLNQSELVDGIMIQLPMSGIKNSLKVLNAISPEKDVDGLNAISLGNVWQNRNVGFAPATAQAVLEVFKYLAIYSDNEFKVAELNEEFIETELKNFLKGKNVLLINNSNIVGKPIAGLLTNYFATVTIAHKYTDNISELCSKSNIIISGTGISGFINKENIPQDAILIDIGINDTARGIGGDMNIEGAEDRIKFVTPVPGGVGPITVASLMKNLVKAATTFAQDKV